MDTEVIWFRVSYVQGPEVDIRNDPVDQMRVHSPYTVVQVHHVAEIQDQVPTGMRHGT